MPAVPRQSLAQSLARSLELLDWWRCELDGLRGIEDLRGARIPWSDLPGNAALFAAALGLHVVD